MDTARLAAIRDRQDARMKLFEEWEKSIVRPILVNLSTAFLLFLFAFVFRDVIHSIFVTNPIKEYPLSCLMESHKTSSDPNLSTDVFVINRSGEEFTDTTLRERLKDFPSDARLQFSPDIELIYEDAVGKIIDATEDAPFNQEKGRLRFTLEERKLTIHVDHIAQRAILKATISTTAPPGMESTEIRKAARTRIPFAAGSLQDRCYKEG